MESQFVTTVPGDSSPYRLVFWEIPSGRAFDSTPAFGPGDYDHSARIKAVYSLSVEDASRVVSDAPYCDWEFLTYGEKQGIKNKI